MGYDPITYPKPEPRYPCAIHGTTRCEGACPGKSQQHAQQLMTGGRRTGKTAMQEQAEREHHQLEAEQMARERVKARAEAKHEPMCTVRGTLYLGGEAIKDFEFEVPASRILGPGFPFSIAKET